MGARNRTDLRWTTRTPYRFQGNRLQRPSNRGLAFATFLTAALVGLGAAAIAQTASSGPDTVGICHATGSSEHPYVYLVVERDGPDHRQHQGHPDDVIGPASADECPAADSADDESACAAESDPAVAAANETDASFDDEPCPADVALNQTGTFEGNRIRFDLTVENLGPEEANDVRLTDDLPDVGHRWRMDGAPSGACTLEGRHLECRLGDMLPDTSTAVSVSALRCHRDCGLDVTNVGRVNAYNDGNPANDAASATIDVPACPETEAIPPAPEPSPGPADNETPPETPPTPAPAPPRSDVSARQTAAQDDERVTLTVTVRNGGPDNATNTTLVDTLPNVGRAWHLGGPDAAECVLDGRSLSCRFGVLPSGEGRTVVLSAYLDKMPCGENLVNTARATSAEDTDPGNDRSSAGILARRC